MIVAGKCPPEREELRSTEEKGFENVELYLERQHLDRFEESLRYLKKSDLNVASVHTPHVRLDEKEYIRKADELAQEFEAYLVMHSSFIRIPHFEEIGEIGLESDHGYENYMGLPVFTMENYIMGEDRELVLDTAHLFSAEKNYYSRLEHLLDNHSDEIGLIHLCDGTRKSDGLGFGEGDIDMERISKLIDSSDFDGILVFEVMPDHQEEAWNKWDDYTG